MNRNERRKLELSKGTADKINELNKPCTVMEAVQLAQGVADDAIANYHGNINSIIVSLSIQIEVLKSMLFESSTLDEEKFLKLFDERVASYNKDREESIKQMEELSKKKANANPSTDVVAGDIETKVETK